MAETELMVIRGSGVPEKTSKFTEDVFFVHKTRVPMTQQTPSKNFGFFFSAPRKTVTYNLQFGHFGGFLGPT